MEKSKIERINYLARKSKTQGLTEEERAEQKILRDEYREGFRRNLTAQLNNTCYIDENGSKIKLSQKIPPKPHERKENKK